jgi:hypothetical protein
MINSFFIVAVKNEIPEENFMRSRNMKGIA